MKTLRSLISVLAFIVGFLSAYAQILYKVEKPGSDKVSYILGSHHLAPLSVIDSISQLPDILRSVDKLYGEIDMAQMTDAGAIMAMRQMLMAPSDSTVDKVLTTSQLDTLSSVWNNLTGGVAPISLMYNMKPAVISTQISGILIQKDFPMLNPAEGIDMTMQLRAREFGKPVEGLETMDFQMAMLYGRPISKQADELMKTVTNIEKEERQSAELSKAYLAHDLSRTLALMEEEEEDTGAMERLVYSRNDTWVERLSREMASKAIMVVVGAAHLPGERGVLKGLEDVGFVITPIE